MTDMSAGLNVGMATSGSRPRSSPTLSIATQGFTQCVVKIGLACQFSVKDESNSIIVQVHSRVALQTARRRVDCLMTSGSTRRRPATSCVHDGRADRAGDGCGALGELSAAGSFEPCAGTVLDMRLNLVEPFLALGDGRHELVGSAQHAGRRCPTILSLTPSATSSVAQLQRPEESLAPVFQSFADQLGKISRRRQSVTLHTLIRTN